MSFWKTSRNCSNPASAARPDMTSHDMDHMTHALRLARQGLGRVWPNPSVGCVIVKDGLVIGVGRTQDGGKPHAEAVALRMAGAEARGASVYVTLEPCNHAREGGCCAQTLIGAGVAEVYAACLDPDPRTSGGGLERLKGAGIKVYAGLCEREAREVNQGFFLRVTRGRPFITLKMATSLDGWIATHTGSSQWITGPEARGYVHGLRSRHDAVLVGIGTVLADDPLLTTRVPGLSHKAVRVVLDSHLGIDIGSKLVQGAANDPLWIFYHDDKDHKKQELEKLGCRLILTTENTEDTEKKSVMSVSSVVQVLAEQGITRLLVEGGSGIHSSFIKAGLFDELHWIRGAKVIGGDGIPVFEALGVDTIDQAFAFERCESRAMGGDVLDVLRRKV